LFDVEEARLGSKLGALVSFVKQALGLQNKSQTSLESNRKLQIFWTNGKSTAVKDSLSDSHG